MGLWGLAGRKSVAAYFNSKSFTAVVDYFIEGADAVFAKLNILVAARFVDTVAAKDPPPTPVTSATLNCSISR